MKKYTKAITLKDLNFVPAISAAGINSKKEEIPGPIVYPKALIPTNIAEYLLIAQISILIAINFLIINRAPPNPIRTLPITIKITPTVLECFWLTVSAK